jgi:PqqD family protein of HPr-rel-A system
MVPSASALEPHTTLTVHRQAQLAWRQLDDEWVVYDGLSGQTLHLDPMRATVLTLLEDGALAVSGLCQQLAATLGQSADQTAAQVLPLIEEFVRLGLVDTSVA